MEEPGRAMSEGRRQIMKEKVDVMLPEILESQGIDMWLTFTREGAVDPIGASIGTAGIVGRTASIFSRAGGEWRKIAIAASYDTTPIEAAGIYDEVIPYRHGQALADAAKNSRMISYDNGHNDFPPGWVGFDEVVEGFLKESGILTGDKKEKSGSFGD